MLSLINQCQNSDGPTHTPQSLKKDSTDVANNLKCKASTDAPQNLNSSDSTYDRTLFFKSSLDRLRACADFPETERECMKIKDQMENYDIDYNFYPSIMKCRFQVDEDAIDIHPSDVSADDPIYPVKVTGDGNCLAYCGSICLFGDSKHGTEIRVRIIIEAVTNKHYYLSHDNLQHGTLGSKCLPKALQCILMNTHHQTN